MVDFIGIGAQKAGTTWLYRMLSEHPDIAFPAGKEVHFWDTTPNAPIAEYTQRFAAEDGKRHGDITPAYAILPQASIARIHTHFPQARLILNLRNPVERAWSAALMDLNRAGLAYAETDDAWFLQHFHSAASKARGHYETCLLNWLSVYPQEQLLIIHFSSIRARPREVLRAVCSHIGISGDIYQEMEKTKLAQKVFAGSGEPLRESLRPHLRALYQESKQRTRLLLSLLQCPSI